MQEIPNRTPTLATLAGALALAFCPAADAQDRVMPAAEAFLRPDPVGGDNYAGFSCDLDGDVAVLGAYNWSNARGRAYVFELQAGVWSQVAVLTDPTGAGGDRFGFDVAVSGDTIVVGAFADHHSGITDPGSAFVFERCGGTWTQVQRLEAYDPEDNDEFGVAVDVDGATIVVGSHAADVGGDTNAGAAYVFVRGDAGTPSEPCDDTWVALQPQLSELVPSSELQVEDRFGRAVATDGQRVAVGAFQDDEPQSNSGSAYVFLRDDQGTTDPTDNVFSLEAKVTAGATAAAANNEFGWSVDIAGERLAVGEPFGDELPLGMGTNNIGAAYVFERSFGSWFLQARLTASDLANGDQLGHAVSLEGGGLLVGAWEKDLPGLSNTRHGAAYLFVRDGVAWNEEARLLAWDARSGDSAGSDVALSGDRALVSAPYDDVTGSGANNGAAWVHRLSLDQAFELFGFGDGDAPVPCPCDNASPAVLEQGCANSLTEFGADVPFGARLAPAGSDSIASGGLEMLAANLIAGQPALCFAGLNRVNGGAGVAFGDGLRLVGGSVQRISVMAPDAHGLAAWSVAAASLPGVGPGAVRHFQVWYRDPVGSPCGTGFDLSNGATVTFGP